MGSSRISALGFGDDILLVSDNIDNNQKLVDICENWVKPIRMYKNLVRPILKYYAQVLTYRNYYSVPSKTLHNLLILIDYAKKLEHFQSRL